ncbi:peptidase C14 [Candidatus Peregrinibacteria bacterium]|jgi:hypothetical protein|nr:peptidase C14 [Candidatus Peregrinibacteria bacterium]
MPYTTDSRDFETLVENAPQGSKKILAEGDSWFAYPRKFIAFGKDANIIDHLGDKNDLIIYNTSSNGDEAVSMLSGEQKFSLIKRLKHNEFDFLLFSGGGNDIVGKFDFDFFIREKTAERTWENCIHNDRVELKISQIKASYEILCELTIDYSKNQNIKIITHTYDDMLPTDEGFELFDLIPFGKSWLHPFLMKKNITDFNDQRNIVYHLLDKFRDAVNEVAQNYDFFTVVDTRGTIDEDEWRNEIHPDSSGFGKIADKILQEGINIV